MRNKTKFKINDKKLISLFKLQVCKADFKRKRYFLVQNVEPRGLTHSMQVSTTELYAWP